MAEILEGPKEWSREVRCTHEDCKALFRAKKEDVVKYDLDEMGISYFAVCPSCGTEVDLENPPPVVEESARKHE